MLLAEKLQEIREGAKDRIPEETRSLMQKATSELRDSGIMETTLQASDALPPFELPNSDGSMASPQQLILTLVIPVAPNLRKPI